MNQMRSGLSVLLPSIGMEMCRLYTIISLLYSIPETPLYPFAAIACVLLAGTLVGRGFSFVTGRRITAVLVYAALCALCVFLIARPYTGFSFWISATVTSFFWFRGVWIGSKGISHAITVTRYDIGIGVIFLIYVMRIGLGEADPYALRIVSAYFLLSILALAASRSWERDVSFITSRPALSLLFPFIAVFFLTSAALVLLFPLLTRAAGGMYVFLREASRPLLDILVAIIRFIFGPKRNVQHDLSSIPDTGGINLVSGQEVSEPSILVKILLGLLVLICVAMVLVITFIIIRALQRYLAEKKGAPGGPGLFASIKILCCFLWDRLRTALCIPGRIVAQLLRRRRSYAGAGQEAFRRLCSWGRASGLPRKKCETPGEYVHRLAARFPSVEEALSNLARGVEEELYGRKTLSAAELAGLKAAFIRLSNPALIPARLASRLRTR